MKTLLAISTLFISAAAFAQGSCYTDSYGNTTCSDGSSAYTDSYGNTTFSDGTNACIPGSLTMRSKRSLRSLGLANASPLA